MVATWIDTRLTYMNLKKNANLNVLSLEDQLKLWTHVIIFENNLYSESSIIDSSSFLRILPVRKFKYRISDSTSNAKIHYFSGSDNNVGKTDQQNLTKKNDQTFTSELTRRYLIQFICGYNMRLYPFDTQTCTIDLALDEVIYKSHVALNF